MKNKELKIREILISLNHSIGYHKTQINGGKFEDYNMGFIRGIKLAISKIKEIK